VGPREREKQKIQGEEMGNNGDSSWVAFDIWKTGIGFRVPFAFGPTAPSGQKPDRQAPKTKLSGFRFYAILFSS
jgi:hypothetical protein